jgi:hypothetical protein
MKTIKCKHCGKTIVVKHGNTKRCEPCKKIARDETSSIRYARISLEADPYWLNEKILKMYHGKDIDPDFLESEGFDFEKYREQIIIDGETVFVMKKFAFSILKNKTVRIWKAW